MKLYTGSTSADIMYQCFGLELAMQSAQVLKSEIYMSEILVISLDCEVSKKEFLTFSNYEKT